MTIIITAAVLAGGLLLLPFFFGAVHESTYLFAYFVFFLLSAWIVYIGRSLEIWLSKGSIRSFPVTTAVLLCCIALIGISAIQLVLSLAYTPADPALWHTSLFEPRRGVIDAAVYIAWTLAVFVAVRSFLSWSPRHYKFITFSVLGCAFFVSLTALGHWFYDNGHLFWVFAPEHVFVSPRARWPFVNANNLAHFLLPAFFLLNAQIYVQRQILMKARFSQRTGRARRLRDLIHHSHAQRALSALVCYVVISLTLLLAMLGSLSRGSWIALVLGSLIMLLGMHHCGSHNAGPKHPWGVRAYLSHARELLRTTATFIRRLLRLSSRPRRRIRTQEETLEETFRKLLSLFGTPLLLVCIVLFSSVFLLGRGGALLEERLALGLLPSVTDIRLRLYQDTLAMIAHSPFLGVGMGNWAAHYPAFMHAGVSGYAPLHLHSDPLQMLAEGGAISLLAITLAFLRVAGAIKGALAAINEPETRVHIVGISAGLAALIAASCIDFPFRIPAIAFYFAVYLALLAHFIEEFRQPT